jgi:predicted dehydrogenase
LDPKIGGGPILSEAIHAIDFAHYVQDSDITQVESTAVTTNDKTLDSKTIALSHANGSVSTIIYSYLGSPRLEKEVIFAHADSQTLTVHNFLTYTHYTASSVGSHKLKDKKGHLASIRAFKDAIASDTQRYPWRAIHNASLSAIQGSGPSHGGADKCDRTS